MRSLNVLSFDLSAAEDIAAVITRIPARIMNIAFPASRPL